MLFEIHITGDKRIHETAKSLGHKSIAIELLRPNYSSIRIDHMTAIHVNLLSVKELYDDYLPQLGKLYYSSDSPIYRVKVECPLTPDYAHLIDKSLYLECHFDATNNSCPTSKNINKTTFLGTDRVYDKTKYLEFYFKYHKEDDIEMAIYDTNVDWDSDWLKYWGK